MLQLLSSFLPQGIQLLSGPPRTVTLLLFPAPLPTTNLKAFESLTSFVPINQIRGIDRETGGIEDFNQK